MNIRKLVDDASSAINRAVQLTEETLGTAEKTQYNERFVALQDYMDLVQHWTEKIVKSSAIMLRPTVTGRVSQTFSGFIDRRKSEIAFVSEDLGQVLIDASEALKGDFSNNSYIDLLSNMGQAEKNLGKTERAYIDMANERFVDVLKEFLENDIEIVNRERKDLEKRRLELDSAKSRFKGASADVLKKPSPNNEDAMKRAESELTFAQNEFDKQRAITEGSMKAIQVAQHEHVKVFHGLIDAQISYHTNCLEILKDKKLRSEWF